MVNTPLARSIRPLYGQCTKKGLGTINKEKTREIECFARTEILVRQQSFVACQGLVIMRLKFSDRTKLFRAVRLGQTKSFTILPFALLIGPVMVRPSFLPNCLTSLALPPLPLELMTTFCKFVS